jgi:HlyD family secretion protein
MTGVDRRLALGRAWALVRRGRWLVVLVAAVLAVGWLRFWRPVAVEVATVERAPVVREAFGRGTIESQREASLGFDLVGRLREVLVDEGDRVTLGQELARLETDQVRAELRSAQTGVGAARTALRRLAAEEERGRAVLDAAEREAARTQALATAGAIPGRERDDADDRVRVARAELDRVLAQRAEATRGIEVAAGVAAQREVTMVRATLLAPFDGLVVRRLREPGDPVAIGATVLRVVDTERVFVRVALDETVLAALEIDQPATITFPGDGATIAGRVTRIPWEADRQTHELLVEVSADRLARRIAIGQRADVWIELARRDDAVRVPLRWLHHDADGPLLYVDRGGRIAVVRPRLGLTGRDHVEILAGVNVGDRVLAAPGAGASLPRGRRWVRR